jgi:hypothetical protein
MATWSTQINQDGPCAERKDATKQYMTSLGQAEGVEVPRNNASGKQQIAEIG